MRAYNTEQRYFLVLIAAVGGRANNCNRVARCLGYARPVADLVRRTIEGGNATRLTPIWRTWCDFHAANVDPLLNDQDYLKLVRRFLHETIL